jgi:diguanylate cyclase (GGDEF)-like protein
VPDTEVPVDRTRSVWLLVLALAALAVPLQWAVDGLPHQPVLDRGVPWYLLAVGFAAAEVFLVQLRWGREAQSFSLGDAPLVLGLFLLSPQSLLLARLVGAGAVLVLYRRHSALKTVFNLVQWWLVTCIALLVWHGVAHPIGAAFAVRVWVLAVVAAVVADGVTTLCISTAIFIRGSRITWSMLWQGLWSGSLTAGANACFALVALDVVTVDWRGAWALAVPAGFLFLALRAHVQLQRRHDTLERLNAFSERLSSRLDVQVVVGDLLAATARLLDAGECELALVSQFGGTGQVYRLVGGHLMRLQTRDDVLPPACGPEARSRRQGRAVPVLTEHLVDRGRVIGALTVRDRLGEKGGFTLDDARMLKGVVAHAASALVNGRLADKLRRQVRENEHQALHDSLTGLPNRVLFDRVLADSLLAGQEVTVLLLDLDRFKEVNDTLGHAAGDVLLREAGERVRAAVPGALAVARLGGDEFALLLPGAQVARARECANAVREALLHPLAMEGITLTVDASVGVAFAPVHGTDAQELLRHADVAMYRAKRVRSGVEVYEPDADDHTAMRLALVSELRDAIRAGDLELWYQPKAELATGAVRCVEALVRWRHAERGLVLPDDFIPVAEQTGLIDPLTDWVLDEALRQHLAWRAHGLQLGVAINVSTRSLRRETFERDVREALRRYDVDPAWLTLEITESAMLEDPEGAGLRLRTLRAIGVRVSVDDFGTGYSSLANLKNLPVDEVKIDKSFVRHLSREGDDAAIVEAVVHLVHRLGLAVVAEGVEDEVALQLLQRMGCDSAQGYLLSRPVPAHELASWLARREVPNLPAPRRAPFHVA